MIDVTIETVRASSEEGAVRGKVQDLQGAIQRGELQKASEQFEAYFISYLLKVMRETVPKGGLLENKMGQVFHAFYDEEIGQRATESGGIGLAQLILSSLAEEPVRPAQERPPANDPS